MEKKEAMKRILFLLATLLLTSRAYAGPNVTISASAVTILGTTQSISITVQLIDPNNTGNLKVSGTGIVPIMRASTVTPGTTAAVGPIYGNDVILDGFGNLNNTYYLVQVFTVSGGLVASTPSLQNYYAFIGSGTIDLATATPLAPSFMNGPLGVTVQGNLAVNGNATGTWAFTGPVLDTSIGSTQVFTIAASPTGIVEVGGGALFTVTTTATCNLVAGQAITIAGAGNALHNGEWVVVTGCGGGSTFQFNNNAYPIAATGSGTVTGSPQMTNGITSTVGPNNILFGGPNPWYDVTSPAFGAKCDGVTDDTAAFQSAINQADANKNTTGGTVFMPPSIPGTCVIASKLDFTGKAGIALVNGLKIQPFGSKAPSALMPLKFTGTCSTSCIVFNNSFDITFLGVGATFPNATNTTVPIVDINSSSSILFNSINFIGPSSTVGPMFYLHNSSTSIDFDGESILVGASILVQGAKTTDVTDQVHFNHVSFFNFGTAAVQNYNVNWTFDSNIFNSVPVATGVPVIGWDGVAANGANLSFTNNLVIEGNGGNSATTNTYTLISLQDTTSNHTGLGRSRIDGNTFLGSSGSTNNTLLYDGTFENTEFTNNDVRDFAKTTGAVVNVNTSGNLTAFGNTFASSQTGAFVGTFLTGSAPSAGLVVDNNGSTSLYGGGVLVWQTAGGGTANTFFNGGIGSSIGGGSLFYSRTAPTIAAAGCGGGAASVTANNGTFAFKINVGTTPGSACTFTMPAATTGWNVHCDDITTQSTSVFVQKQTGAESTTSVTITNFNDVAVATAFVASDVLKCMATGE